jgi:hypothetical protein
MYVNDSHPYLTDVIVIFEVATWKLDQRIGTGANRLRLNRIYNRLGHTQLAERLYGM